MHSAAQEGAAALGRSELEEVSRSAANAACHRLAAHSRYKWQCPARPWHLWCLPRLFK